jgi:putative transcriptional regulator
MGKAFDSIRQGLTEAIGHAKGKQAGVKEWRPSAVDVAGVRERIGFTQAQFAARFGVSVATLRHWERGDRTPQGPALVLLNLIDRDPAGVLRLLAGGSLARGGPVGREVC